LEYVGRADDQVKVRGFRIEPGEVEEALVSRAGIRQAVVVAREDEPGDQRLVGYVVGSGGAVPTAEELRRHLREVLPEYMVPAVFVVMEELPQTPSGKLDRKKLPVPDVAQQLHHRYVAPQTPTEEILAQIWAEVLGVDHVGVDDNFFELGGHSLLAIRIARRAREATGVEVPMAAIFSRLTVKAMAASIDTVYSSVA
jgi:acyl carrier protein